MIDQKKYNSHYGTILAWHRRNEKEKQNTYTRVEQPLNYNTQGKRDPNYQPNPELVARLKNKYEPKKSGMDKFNEVLDRFVAKGDDEE